MFDYIDWLAQ